MFKLYTLFLYVAAMLLFASCPTWAQVRAVATLAPARVETGDTFALRVIVSGTAVAPREVRFAAWAGLLPMANVLSKSEWRRSGDTWRQDFTLIAFDSADHALPPLYVYTHLGDSIPTNPLQLKVFPTPASADLADMAPVRDIRREPVHWTDYWPWMAGAVLLIGLLWWRFGRKKPKVALPPPVQPDIQQPSLPAHLRALQQLDAMERQQIWKQNGLKEYYVELSLVVRAYLENRYRIPAMESTTREIMGQLHATDYPESLKGTLKEALDQADGVKYAQSKPAAEAPLQALRKVRFLVEKTG